MQPERNAICCFTPPLFFPPFPSSTGAACCVCVPSLGSEVAEFGRNTPGRRGHAPSDTRPPYWCQDLTQMAGCTHQTPRGWVANASRGDNSEHHIIGRADRGTDRNGLPQTHTHTNENRERTETVQGEKHACCFCGNGALGKNGLATGSSFWVSNIHALKAGENIQGTHFSPRTLPKTLLQHGGQGRQLHWF